MIELFIGGARSGKSRLAEQVAQASRKKLIYIATAQAGDNEMSERIAKHITERQDEWHTIEEPLNLGDVIRRNDDVHHCVLVDCLTLWLSNCLTQISEAQYRSLRQDFLDSLKNYSGKLLLVSNEVNAGIVPSNALARNFIDESGWLQQDLAKIADRVVHVVAGLPHVLKGEVLGELE